MAIVDNCREMSNDCIISVEECREMSKTVDKCR